MKEKLRLSVTTDYQSIIRRIVFVLFAPIVPFVLLGLLLEYNSFTVPAIAALFITSLIFLPFMVHLIISLAKSYIVDNLWFEEECISFDQLDELRFDEIVSYKEIIDIRWRIYSIVVFTLKDHKKIAIGPSSNFSAKAINEYKRFKELLKEKY